MPEPHHIPWHLGRAFSSREVARYLAGLERERSRVPSDGAPPGEFEHYYSQALIAREVPGLPPPGGAFERARELSARYEFSDPRIVIGHFDPHRPLLGRPLALELRALGLRILAGVRVTAVETQSAEPDVSVFAWRYDTLPGHVEFGSEWFRVLARHATGEVSFQIEARWRRGEFPSWWMRAGFRLTARRYQRAWHRLAYVRMRHLLGSGPLPALPSPRNILHSGTPLNIGQVRSMGGSAPRPDLASEQTTAHPREAT